MLVSKGKGTLVSGHVGQQRGADLDGLPPPRAKPKRLYLPSWKKVFTG